MAEFKPVKCPPGCRYSMCSHAFGKETVKHCGYILHTGERRGCDPGPGCTRYRRGGRLGNCTHIRLGGPKFAWDEPAGKRMWLEGKTDRQIADALGTRRDNVGRVRRLKWMKEKQHD